MEKRKALWKNSYAWNLEIGRNNAVDCRGGARGGARSISMRALSGVAGFRDVIAPDSGPDIRLKKHGERVKMEASLIALRLRKMSLARSVFYQIKAGEPRSQLGVSPLRILLARSCDFAHSFYTVISRSGWKKTNRVEESIIWRDGRADE